MVLFSLQQEEVEVDVGELEYTVVEAEETLDEVEEQPVFNEDGTEEPVP